MQPLRRLAWNPRNIAHIARHGLTYREVEEVIQNPYLTRQSRDGRFELLGHSKAARMLMVVVEPLDDGEYYVITARPASRKERRRYLLAFGTESEDA